MTEKSSLLPGAIGYGCQESCEGRREQSLRELGFTQSTCCWGEGKSVDVFDLAVVEVIYSSVAILQGVSGGTMDVVNLGVSKSEGSPRQGD